MFYVYYGHVNADNHDIYPTHKLRECKTNQDVFKIKKEFDECSHEDCSDVVFKIVDGDECKLTPRKEVTHWDLIRCD